MSNGHTPAAAVKQRQDLQLVREALHNPAIAYFRRYIGDFVD